MDIRIANYSASASMADCLAKRENVFAEGNPYHDCRFILGSAAEIERVFSVAIRILVDRRHAVTPQVYEPLIFLKCNSRFWHAELVSEAVMLYQQNNTGSN